MAALDETKYATTINVRAQREVAIGMGKTSSEMVILEFTLPMTVEELDALAIQLEPVSDPIT